MSLQTIRTSVLKFIEDEEGLTIVEYAVAGGLVTLGAVAAFLLLGNTVCGAIGALQQAIMGNAVAVTPC